MKKSLFTACIFLTVALFNSCSDDNGFGFNTGINNTDHAATAGFTYYIGVNSQTQLVLDGINGAVNISPTDGNLATISGERKVESESDADAQAFLENLKVIFEDRGDEVFVQTQQPSNTYGRVLSVTYNIKIPASWDIIISNINGGLQVDSLTGDIDASITNGSILLNNGSGNVALQLVNGTIVGKVVVPESGYCSMNLTNGTIALNIPQATNAILDAHVVNGTVNVTNLSMTNINSSSSSFIGTIGSGSASINLAAVNGGIEVAGF